MKRHLTLCPGKSSSGFTNVISQITKIFRSILTRQRTDTDVESSFEGLYYLGSWTFYDDYTHTTSEWIMFLFLFQDANLPWLLNYMMTSSNGNIFRVTGPLCGEFTGPGEFPTQRPVTRSFDVYFDLCLNKRLSKQPWGWWFETPS